MEHTAASEPGTPEDLQILEDAFARADAAMTEAAAAIGRLAGSGVCESVEGLELEHWLRLAGKLPGASARRVAVTGELLADLPHLRRLLEDGRVSFACVEMICTQLRGLSREQRHTVDQRMAATVAAREHDVEAFGADGLIEATLVAVDDLRDPSSLRRREQRRERSSRTVLQPRLDGTGGTSWSDLGPLAWQIHRNALEQAATDAQTAGDTPELIPTGTPDEPADPVARRGGQRSRAQRLAMGLRRMGACDLGHPDDRAPGDSADDDGGEEDRGEETGATARGAAGGKADGGGPGHGAGEADPGNGEAPGKADGAAGGGRPSGGAAGRGHVGTACAGRRGWRPARPLFEAVIDLSDVCTATAPRRRRLRPRPPRPCRRRFSARSPTRRPPLLKRRTW